MLGVVREHPVKVGVLMLTDHVEHFIAVDLVVPDKCAEPLRCGGGGHVRECTNTQTPTHSPNHI